MSRNKLEDLAVIAGVCIAAAMAMLAGAALAGAFG